MERVFRQNESGHLRRNQPTETVIMRVADRISTSAVSLEQELLQKTPVSEITL